jgi:AraC-like DNA-binding protein
LTVSGTFFAVSGVLRVRLRELVDRFAPAAMQGLPLLLWHDLPAPSPIIFEHVDFHAIFLIERGRGVHVIDSTRYAVSRGDVYLLGSGAAGRFLDTDRLLVHAVLFQPSLFDRSTWAGLAALPGFESLLVGRRLHLPPTAYAETAQDHARLWSEWRSDTPAGAVMVRALLATLLVRLARLAAGDAPPVLTAPARAPDRDVIVAGAVRTIDLRYAESLRVAELAAAAHISADHFTDIFSAVMGRTPRDYIRHVRLEHAKTLLATTTLPISDVARTSGFRAHATFTRAFAAATGSSPREFRRRAGAAQPRG